MTLRVEVVSREQQLEDIPVPVEAFHLVQDDGLCAVGTLFAVFIELFWEAFKVLAVEVQISLGDRFLFIQGMVHGDELLVVSDRFE